jgi:hypothetical protein
MATPSWACAHIRGGNYQGKGAAACRSCDQGLKPETLSADIKEAGLT